MKKISPTYWAQVMAYFIQCFLCSDLCQWNHFLLWYLSFCKPRRNVFSLAINCFRRFLRTPSVTNVRFLIFYSFWCFTLSIAARLSSFPFSISVVCFGIHSIWSLAVFFSYLSITKQIGSKQKFYAVSQSYYRIKLLSW